MLQSLPPTIKPQPGEDLADVTKRLHESEERFRTLFLQEQRRARHLSLINQVQKCALSSREVISFLPQVTRAIHSHFPECDITFFLCPWASRGEQWGDESEPMEVVALAGEHNLSEPVGVQRPVELFDEKTGAPPYDPDSRSSLCVVVRLENQVGGELRGGELRVGGALVVQSREENILDGHDFSALQTASAIIGAFLQNARLILSMTEAGEFNKELLNSMTHSLMVVDERGAIRFVNERLLQTFGKTRDEVKKVPIEQLLGEGPTQHHRLREAMEGVLESGAAREIPEVHVWTHAGPQIFDVRLFRVFFRGEAEAAILLINLTLRWRKTYQLQLLHEIGALFQESLDIERVLASVLTCVTAGSALGFNRAFVFLFDEADGFLEGRMALGPSSSEEAGKIWGEISQREFTLAELMGQNEAQLRATTPLQQHTRSLRINPQNPCFGALHDALEAKSTQVVTRDELLVCDAAEVAFQKEALALGELLRAPQIAIAPLRAKERLVGVVFADNLYSGAPIEEADAQTLDTLAQNAGLAIDNALTYEDLQTAQRELVSAERLVAVGEMAARVSHEIRNPLATIGGFARQILRRADDPESVKKKTQVVIDEVARLEELLTDLLDMARPRPLCLAPHSPNEVVEHALLLAEAEFRACDTKVEKDLAPNIGPILFDRSRLLQALLNTIRNGAQAMPGGGTLRVATRLSRRDPNSPEWLEIEIADTGVGISKHALRQVFDPFFSTKISGSGLGLPVTKRIIQDHGGHIDIESEEGVGTKFVFSIPARREGTG